MTLGVLAFVAIVALSVGGFMLHETPPQLTLLTSPTHSPSAEASPTPTSSPEPTPSDIAAPSPTKKATVVAGTSVQISVPSPSPKKPSPTPTQSTPSPSPTPETVTASSDIGIEFVDLPSSIHAGDSFTVTWRVNGPSGTAGHDATLKVVYEAKSSSGGSSSSVSSNTSSSFGSFTTPRTFSSKFSFGDQASTVHLTASAEVGGQNYTASRDIELTN